MSSVPFQIGALYSRRDEIHSLIGGQRQGGNLNPGRPAFRRHLYRRSRRSHGYADLWESERTFDRVWITFEDSGLLARATELPREIERRLGLNLKPGRKCGGFSAQQRSYLEYHRNKIFEQRFLQIADPVEDLVMEMATINA